MSLLLSETATRHTLKEHNCKDILLMPTVCYLKKLLCLMWAAYEIVSGIYLNVVARKTSLDDSLFEPQRTNVSINVKTL